jgi:hypothetical protein
MPAEIKQRAWFDHHCFQTEEFSIHPMNSSTKKETALWIVKADGEGTEISLDVFNKEFKKLFERIM